MTDKEIKEQIEKDEITIKAEFIKETNLSWNNDNTIPDYVEWLEDKLIESHKQMLEIDNKIDTIKTWFQGCPRNLDFDKGYAHGLYSVLKLLKKL